MKTTVPEEIVNALYRKRSELHMISAYYALWGDIQIWYAGTRLLITTYWPHYLESFDLPMNVSWKENTLPGPRVQRHHTKNEEELRNDQTARSAHSQLGEVLTMTLEIQRMELISVCKKSEVVSPKIGIPFAQVTPIGGVSVPVVGNRRHNISYALERRGYLFLTNSAT